MRLKQTFSNNKYLFISGFISLLITLIISIQNITLGKKSFVENGPEYSRYNNFIIFKNSFHHLIQQINLYQYFPKEHFDLYKYSPTFAVLMYPFTILPDYLGLFIWNFINCVVVAFAIKRLTISSDKKKIALFLFILVEMVTSLQNSQSNGLIAGLLLLSFTYFEENKLIRATFLITLTVFIKIFGVFFFLILFFYPNKLKSILYSLGWTIIFFLIPLLVISPSEYFIQLMNWKQLLLWDNDNSWGFSVAGWLHYWFGSELKSSILLIGMIFLLLPVFFTKCYETIKYRRLYAFSILIWLVIFNHKAESPTFIISILGIGSYLFLETKNKKFWILLLFNLLFTELAPTDLFPKFIREQFFVPYVIKAIPSILTWVIIYLDLFKEINSTYQLNLLPTKKTA